MAVNDATLGAGSDEKLVARRAPPQVTNPTKLGRPHLSRRAPLEIDDPDPAFVALVVGPCVSGKSTLVAALRAAGYEARHPAQEHSYVKDMWRRLVDPDVLIYLDISYEALLERRPFFGERAYLEREQARLAHAREHADLVVDTSGMTAEAVREQVLATLEGIKLPRIRL